MSAASSATSVEAGASRHGIAAGSTDSEATGRSVVGILLSAGTLQTMCSDIRLARLVDFRATLENSLPNADATTGIVTRLVTVDKGESWIYESPTLRLSAGTFQPTGLFGPAEGLITNMRCVRSPSFIALRVAGLGTAAQPIVYTTGLLNSTDRLQGASRLVESKFAEAVALAGKEWFEDGVESEFSRALSTLLHTYRDAAIAPVETFFISPSANVEVAVEAARWLGRVDHPASRHYRRTLLEKVLLNAPSTRLRHGAASGLAAMDDPFSLPAVVEASNRESNQRLRRFLQLVVDQLERTRACRSS